MDSRLFELLKPYNNFYYEVKTYSISICPICKGEGKLVKYLVPEMPFKEEKECHGCKGKGWISCKEL